MSVPRITKCGDGHYCRVIYGPGPYIGDYPEQVLLACIVTGWCPQYVLSHLPEHYLSTENRCTAPNNDLDSDSPRIGRRSHKHTELLMDAATNQELWDSYGLIGDIMVRMFLSGNGI